jgi:hypothetical protein
LRRGLRAPPKPPKYSGGSGRPPPARAALPEVPEGLEPLARAGMGREEAALAAAGGLDEPGERGDHDVLRVPRPFEDLHAVRVRRVLFAAAVAAGDQLAGHRRDGAAARNDLIEDDGWAFAT